MEYKYKDLVSTKEQLHSYTYTFIMKHPTVICTWLIANFTRLTPNEVTLLSFVPYVFAAGFFYKGMLLYGALFYFIASLLDGADGRLARLKGLGSKFGAFFDNYVGGWGYTIMFISYFYGQYLSNKNSLWFVLGLFSYYIFLLHGRVALQVKNLVGEKYSMKMGENHKKMGKQNFIWRMPSLIVSYLAKKGCAEPFHLFDIEFIVFFIGPIIETFYSGVLIIIIFISLIILLIKEIFWFNYYKKILKEADGK